MKHLVLGIDPGLRGGFAFYDLNTNALSFAALIPTNRFKKDGAWKREIDQETFAFTLGLYADKTLFAVIEKVGSRPGQGVASTFKFGLVTGIVTGAISANNIPIQHVEPAVWKGILNLSRNKKASVDLAVRKFGQSFKHDGPAEAALLAWFGATRLVKKA